MHHIQNLLIEVLKLLPTWQLLFNHYQRHRLSISSIVGLLSGISNGCWSCGIPNSSETSRHFSSAAFKNHLEKAYILDFNFDVESCRALWCSWVREMYAFSIAVAKAKVDLDLPKNPRGIMVQVSPPTVHRTSSACCDDGYMTN